MTRMNSAPARERGAHFFRRAGVLVFTLAAIAGCSGGGGSPTQPIVGGGGHATPTPTPKPSSAATATPAPSSAPTTSASCVSPTTATIGGSGGSITASAATGTFTETFAAGQVPASTTVSLGYIAQSGLPAPLAVARFQQGYVRPLFTQGAGNTYVAAFCAGFGGATPTSGVALSGASGIVPSSIAVGTQLNIAINANNTWVDVGTASVTSTGTFQSTPPTLALPGITKAGNYLVYVPASGTNTAQINLGFALLADDSSASLTNGLQFVQIENASGAALSTPTTSFYPVTGSDLDGQSLTEDASHGAVVDGSNTVYFFSGIPQHTFNLATGTVDVTAYGGDGDSIASLPGGDQVVVTGNGTQLAVISGVLAGSPVVSDTINNPGGTFDRDGLVTSLDGKVMLSRGNSGLDVYTVAPVAAHAGSTGVGKTSFAFTLTKSFTSGVAGGVLTPFLEDGRDEMAISPTDSSRALIAGADTSGGLAVQLLTGLTGSSPTANALPLRVPLTARRLGNAFEAPEPSGHRRPFSLTPSVGTEAFAVAISADGTTGYVSTDAGIVTVSGVNTGTLAQVGTVYSPTLTIPGGSCPLTFATTIGVLPDGKYLIANVNPAFGASCSITPGSTNTTQGDGILVVIPIGSGGALGAPVAQLIQTVTPFNDQMITH